MMLALALLTSGCVAPVGVVAASYGADGVSLADSGKTMGDHFASMVTKKDCALWRVVQNRKVCYEREGDRDPYQVNYDEAFRDQSEGGGVEFHPPLHAAPDAPVTSWNAGAYKAAPTPAPAEPAQPVTAVADAKPAPAPAAAPAPPAAPAKAKTPNGERPADYAAAAKKKARKPKPSPDQAAAGL
jgi:hypothetical protein